MESDKRQRVGIMGGTFDPIHIGHLIISEEVREKFNLDYVLFVPARVPPHKQESAKEAIHRYNMVKLAIKGNPRFCVSDIEMKRNGPSYTIDTLREFRQIYGKDTDLYFIAGTDTIRDLPNWNDHKELLSLCEFIGATRPDGTDDIEDIITYFGDLGSRIHRLRVPKLEISSTELRQRLKEGRNVRYLLPDAVLQYIKIHGVYKHE